VIAPLDALLEPVARIKGVRAVILAAEDDGVPVHAIAHEDVDAETLAALGCRLYRSARLASERAGFGASGIMHVEADEGQVCVARAGGHDSSLVLIVLAESDANTGALRQALSRAATDAVEAT
jgi:predicted regulator of Ras-like GTPase activity (Roadblock/LC7/MglB family)